MLGKERNNDMSDSQFVDQGWSAMSKMLEQEMPVAEAPAGGSKGRYGLFLLFLLIGFASGIGTMMFIQEGDHPVKTEEAIPVPLKSNPQEVAQTEDPIYISIPLQ